MELSRLIISALTVGSVAVSQETAGTATKDAYQELFDSIRQKLKKEPKAIVALQGYTKNPKTWQKNLEKAIREAGILESQEIIDLARKVLELAASQRSSSKYEVNITGNVRGFVQGDNAQVTMNFEDKPTKNRPRLAGDTSTDAPPPKSKKTRKNK
jgi:hypothetical protein